MAWPRQFIPPRRMASIGVILEAFQAGYRPARSATDSRAGQADGDEPRPEFEREAVQESVGKAHGGHRHRDGDRPGKDAQQRALGHHQGEDVAPRPAAGAHHAELDEPLVRARQHRVRDADPADQERQADGREEAQVELSHDSADRGAELADPPRIHPREGRLDAAGQGVGVGDPYRFHVEGGDGPVRHPEQPPRHADVHDDRHVGDERPRLVQADDGEVVVADPDRLADPLRRAIGIRVVAGDPRADHDAVSTDVAQVEEAPPAALLGEDRRCEHRTLELEVLGEVLPLDEGHGGRTPQPRLARPGQQADRDGTQTAPAVDRRGDLPDLGGDDAHARDPSQGRGHVRGQVAEHRARRVPAHHHQPLHRVQGAAHQLTDPLGDAEQPEEREHRDRQSDGGQGRARRPRHQILPGETPHGRNPSRRKNRGRRGPTRNPWINLHDSDPVQRTETTRTLLATPRRSARPSRPPSASSGRRAAPAPGSGRRTRRRRRRRPATPPAAGGGCRATGGTAAASGPRPRSTA